MASIKDVADKASLSIATVSRFFNAPELVREKTRIRIQEAIDALGYAPNHLARNFRTGTTGIILVISQAISDPQHGAIIAGIIRVATDSGYTVRVQDAVQLRQATGDFVDLIASRQADGIIILGHAGRLGERSRDLDKANLPIVVCGETSDPNLEHFARFEVDGRQAMCELVAYLIGLGHRRIAFIKASVPLLDLRHRESGYIDALAQAGIPLDEALICDAHFKAQLAREAVSNLLALPDPPTAIACATDEMALGVLAELHARGVKVPDQISVTGYDNTRYAELASPPLTTVAQPAEEIGERGMRTLIRLIAGHPVSRQVELLDHNLVLRKSVTQRADRISA